MVIDITIPFVIKLFLGKKILKMEIEFTTTERGNRKLIKSGYMYVFNP